MRAYLGMIEVRMGGRLRIELDVPAALHACEFARVRCECTARCARDDALAVRERGAGMMRPAPGRSLARLLGRGAVFGTLWGLGITASEALVLPFGQFESLDGFIANFGPILVDWCIEGTLMACGTLAVEPWLDRAWKVAAATGACAVMTAAINSALWAVAPRVGLGAPPRLIAESFPSWSHALHTLWMALFYGGLFIIACVLLSRAERTRLVLGEAQIARDKSDALLDRAQIEALYGQVEPAFLIRARRVVRDRYASDAASADQLLDDLVAFLRLACRACAAAARRWPPSCSWRRAMRRSSARSTPSGRLGTSTPSRNCPTCPSRRWCCCRCSTHSPHRPAPGG